MDLRWLDRQAPLQVLYISCLGPIYENIVSHQPVTAGA